MDVLSQAPNWSALASPTSESEEIKAIFFAGPPYQGKPTRVFAWLGIPKVKNGGHVPGMVLVHGGGGTAFEYWVRMWVDRGYAAIAMDTCGQVPVGKNDHWVHDDQGGPPGWGGWDQIDRPLTNQWTYQAVCDVILAHSLLRSMPDVDPERTGITGVSWGGYLTCIVAGVDSRFKLAVPVYGCGFTQTNFFAGSLAKLSKDQSARWLGYWDPSVYVGNAAMPFLWVDGSNDFAYTMNALQLTYRLPRGSRTLCVRLCMPHGHGGPGEKPKEIKVFANHILKGGKPLPHMTGQGRDGSHVWATFETEVRVAKAELNYTKDTGPWQSRKWEAVPADVTGTRITATLPAGTQVYYMNLYDERECVVSTEHEECNMP